MQLRGRLQGQPLVALAKGALRLEPPLEVMEAEQLDRRAAQMGRELRARLAALNAELGCFH